MRGVGVRHVAGEQRGTIGRADARSVGKVLHGDRQPVQHAEPATARSGFVSRGSPGDGPLFRQGDDCVELGVDPVDPLQERVE